MADNGLSTHGELDVPCVTIVAPIERKIQGSIDGLKGFIASIALILRGPNHQPHPRSNRCYKCCRSTNLRNQEPQLLRAVRQNVSAR